MIARASISLLLATTLALGLGSVALADTFSGPAGNDTAASGGFVQVIAGVEYDWSLGADRDTIAGYSIVYASYTATVSIVCHGGAQDGQPGERDIDFNGQANAPFVVSAKLSASAAGARVRGTEDTFDTCTGSFVSVARSFIIGFALHATDAASTFTEQQCVDFSDNGDAPMLLTLTGASRNAAGAGLVNGRPVRLTGGSISHRQWSSVADSSCAA